MKNLLLYFFAVALCVTLLPLTPHLLPPQAETPRTDRITLLESRTQTVRELSLEEYVIGVLSYASYPYTGEALKAIAVALRSSALYCEQNRPVHAQAAVCDDPDCCGGYLPSPYGEAALQAVSETAGMVLFYQDAPAAAVTHESCGGYTESSLAVYGVELPYLTVLQNIPEDVKTERCWTVGEFLSLLGVPDDTDPDTLWLAYDSSERVREASLAGQTLSGEALAERLSLPSCCFTLEREGETVYACCYGKGSGVGMSRNGASLLAQSGMDCKAILQFYYPQTTLHFLS